MIGFIAMDITVVSKNIIRIKGKHCALLIGMSNSDSLKTKTSADCLLLLNKAGSFDTSKVDGLRLLIKGPGDYEVAGVKISVTDQDSELVYNLQIDGMDLLLGSTDSLAKIKDKLKQCNALILYANSDIDSALITAIEPRVAVFYGEKAIDCVKILGKVALPVSKITLSTEKLPAEMETVYLE
ncbi:MAG: hypothetical protein A3H79_02435 [Candidatus Levybacteria bacterium RIFCSPLOWO2_02_FULL_36_8b]|nr:MAG: hypothetical protein A3H79_02435 [Candidatus Levybacteria bacterium RIFCSPLOWO2_02_FULL_36_8b]